MRTEYYNTNNNNLLAYLTDGDKRVSAEMIGDKINVWRIHVVPTPLKWDNGRKVMMMIMIELMNVGKILMIIIRELKAIDSMTKRQRHLKK